LKTALITGANRGLGLGFTRHYLENGWQVIAASRSPGQSDDFREFESHFGSRLHCIDLDVSNEQSIAALPARSSGIELDLLVNNAGVSIDENLGGWTAEAFARTLAVNTIGPALVAQALAPLMKAGSLLVNISSGLASMGMNINPETGLDAYAASKAALNMLTHRLAAKLKDREITVVCLDPGWVQTSMGGEQAPLTVDESIAGMTALISNLSSGQTGLFLNANGDELPW
jgi:NAD(P)-dependent dehydrogenase (short-subunit alcohol dehydrogenase family)